MSDDIIEYVVAHAGQSRRQFLVRLLATSAFAAPVIASFAIGGTSSPKRSPLDAGANSIVDCGPNATFDEGANLCVVDEGPNVIDEGPNVIDEGPNVIDEGPNEFDGGSNDLDGGSNETDEGSGGVGGDGGGIPSTL